MQIFDEEIDQRTPDRIIRLQQPYKDISNHRVQKRLEFDDILNGSDGDSSQDSGKKAANVGKQQFENLYQYIYKG